MTVNAAKRRAAKSGNAGERTVKAYNAAALAAGLARLDKVPTEKIMTPQGLRHTARSTVDFVGYMKDGTGRVVAVEVKTCTSKKSFGMSELEAHQRAYLDDVDAAGGVAVLVVVHTPAHLVSVIPWHHVSEGIKTLNAEFLGRYVVSKGDYLKRFVDDEKTSLASAFGLNPAYLKKVS